MLSVPDLFALAWQHHQAGDLPQAEQLYRQILQSHPSHADAWCFLGAVFQAQNRLTDAEAHFRRAVQLVPAYANAHNCLGVLLAQQGQLADAITSFQQVVRLEPANAEAHYNLGLAFNSQSQRDAAVSHFREALRIKPDYPEALNDLGNALAAQEKLHEAVGNFVEAVCLRPNYAEAHYNLGIVLGKLEKWDEAIAQFRLALRRNPQYVDALVNLGNALRQIGRLDEAMAQCEQALRISPNHAAAHCSLGVILADLGRIDSAIASLRQALRIQPEFPEAHSNLGNSLVAKGDLEQALWHCKEALRLSPNNADAHNNLATALYRNAKWQEALVHYDQAIRLRPHFPTAHLNRAQIYLTLGDFEQGWPEFEWRATLLGAAPRVFSEPRWDGSNLGGRRILLYAEQGLGDTIQFIRYAPLVKQKEGYVFVECQPPLLPLLANIPGIDRLVATGAALPTFDFQAPLLSLPGILHTTLETIPNSVPYLYADAQLVEKWRGLKGSATGTSEFLVGIAWQGDTAYRYDRQRSFPLSQFAPLATVKGVRLISLQKGWGVEQLRGPKQSGSLDVVDLGDGLDKSAGAFMDTAAIMANLDLVICSDTAIAHLAGALAVPVWVALPFVPDWRWLQNGENCAWYPTMRLFRQTRCDHWEDVFERIAAQLSRAADHKRSSENRLKDQ